ncbi:hypothetical protein CENSYa_1424 [Cenarchaeum symbiosum A]|uniref:DUF7482 domain-containing protein n=1 Tax=Cenarchaeum symbiosum (strain A) TaxID=414004 RepID=A0RXH9_CENSY|nr:hypothetical protein CENSYa_1424 [Cenarchaeum symbiosum A]
MAATLAADQPAQAGVTRKMHFTQTVESSPDPGMDRGGDQMAIILSPNEGTLYDGSMTYAADGPVQVMVLHRIDGDGSGGQAVWTVDGEDHFAVSLIGPGASSGSSEFTGSALALHAEDGFTATVSVDGWMRGQLTEVVVQTVNIEEEAPPLKLSRARVPVEMPLVHGLYGGEGVLYVLTDASDLEYSAFASERIGWDVAFSPLLANATAPALSDVYVFTNGVEGNGSGRYQDDVFTDTPGQPGGYSPLRRVNEVEWKFGQNPEMLSSAEEVLGAEEDGRVEIEDTGIVANMPHVKWPDGQMDVRDSAEITSDSEYGGAQLAALDEANMTVTFVAHRGWGPDGRTVYHIITGATPAGPAGMMGAVDSPALEDLAGGAAAAAVYQFNNGIRGPGPLGFQPSVFSTVRDDDNYTPIWSALLVSWDDPSDAAILGTVADIEALEPGEVITVAAARPLNSAHVINAPLVDPFQMQEGTDAADDQGMAEDGADEGGQDAAEDDQADEDGGMNSQASGNSTGP